MCIAGGKEPRISSAAVSEIITLAADGDGWTASDKKGIGDKHEISADDLSTLEGVIRDYFVSEEERPSLAALMSGKDVRKFAGKSGKKLLSKRLKWFEDRLTSHGETSEDAETRRCYMYRIFDLGMLDDEVLSTIKRLSRSDDMSTKAIAESMFRTINTTRNMLKSDDGTSEDGRRAALFVVGGMIGSEIEKGSDCFDDGKRITKGSGVSGHIL